MAEGNELHQWWLASFSDDDREWMLKGFGPESFWTKPVLYGIGQHPHPFRYLTDIAQWLNKPGRGHCAIAFVEKSLDFYSPSLPVLDRHFGLHGHCKVFYRWRDAVVGALEAAVLACETCIEFHQEAYRALHDGAGVVCGHGCFEQLRIIEEKRGNYRRAIQLCQIAQAGGWAGDWEKHVKRLLKRVTSVAALHSIGAPFTSRA